MLYDDQNRQIHQDKVDQELPGPGLEEERDRRKAIANGYAVSFWGKENVLELVMMLL